MKKVMLISLDALSETEFDRLKKLDNFSKFIANGVYSKKSVSVYPTQTYTVHTSVITGKYPNKHGVYNNQYFQPFVESENKEWFWYRHQVKSDTLYDVLRKKGKRVCSVLWPVTGKAKIKYNIPEIVAINNENQALKVMKNSSFLFALRNEVKHGKIRQGVMQPQLDEYAKTIALDCVRRHMPDMVMLHLVCIDAAKHTYGVEGKEMDKALAELDRMIGEIVDVCQKDYTIVMFSDHGQFTVKKDVHINVFLQDRGMLSFDRKAFHSYVQCMGGSGVIRAQNKQMMQKTIKLIEKNKDMLGIEEIYDREMLDRLNVDKDIEYIIEAKEGYHLKEGENSEVIKDLAEHNIVHATHGYSPLKDNYRCVFFAMGEDIKQGIEIDKMEVVDIAPTVAKMMDIDNFECDGRIMEEIFK